jgi:hypothetical protein
MKMRNMKGLYINDIPVNLFMEYFNRTNLTPLEFTPKYTEPVIYKHQFKIDSVTYYYKSMFAFSYIESEDISEFFPNGTITDLSSPIIDDQKLYYNNIIPFIYPYRYRLEKIQDEELLHFIHFEEDGTSNEIKELEPKDYINVGINILDSRSNTSIYSDISLQYEKGKQRWRIIDGTLLLGYIYENALFQLQATNADGYLLYIDEYGRETTQREQTDNFSKHYKSIRSALNNIKDTKDNVERSFLPNCIGMIDNGITKKLVYYEEYKRTRTFSLAASTENFYYKELIDRNLLKDLDEDDKIIEEKIIKMRTLLDFSTLPNLRVTKETPGWIPIHFKSGIDQTNSVGYYYNTVNNNLYLDEDVVVSITATDTEPSDNQNNDFWLTITTNTLYQYKSTFYYKKIDRYLNNNRRETALLKVYETYLNFMGKLSQYRDKQIIFNSTFSLYGELIGANKFASIKVPVGMASYTNTNSQKYNIIYLNENNREARLHSQLDDNGHYFLINDKKYYINETIEAPNYPNGSVILPVRTEFVSVETLFGDLVNLHQKDNSVFLEKFDTSKFSNLANLDENRNESVIVKDLLDSTIYIEKEEKYEKVAPAGSHIISEFLDYYHSYNGTGTSIELKNGRTLYRLAQINNPVSLSMLINDFSFEHYITQGFQRSDITSSRGNLVPEKLFNDKRTSAMKEMVSSFMEKRYDNFLFDDPYNIFEDNIFMKMRVYAEGYKEFLDNDINLYSLNTAVKPYISYKNIPNKIIISEIDQVKKDFLTKIYKTSLEYISDQLSKDTSFTRIIESDKFPISMSKKKHLAEQSKKIQAYNDFKKTTNVFNDIDILTRTYRKNTPSNSEYKKFLIFNLIENFYLHNNYSGQELFPQNYNNYLKNIVIENSNYTEEISNVSEKVLYFKDSLDLDDLNDILSKILDVKTEEDVDWKVL